MVSKSECVFCCLVSLSLHKGLTVVSDQLGLYRLHSTVRALVVHLLGMRLKFSCM